MYVIGSNSARVNEYNLGAAWDISTAVFFQFFLVAAQDLSPQGVFFRVDGLKMYVIGLTNGRVYEYNLGAAWDISTAVFLQFFSVALQDGRPNEVFFKPTGLKMYVVGATNDSVYEYDLGTAWNVSTAVFLQLFSVAAQAVSPTGLFFKPDGSQMYITQNGVPGTVFQYSL
jgi:DNA-binding beta-propeller fold protein YncE